jgi:hypothetical protein
VGEDGAWDEEARVCENTAIGVLGEATPGTSGTSGTAGTAGEGVVADEDVRGPRGVALFANAEGDWWVVG